ncbi:SDR family NAD(P)-dependent oxidoreductase [Nonomuraea aridisoli]|uniref:Short-chain dehydrogenase n=1 Tax=Nonomuraea aridisoli TaxID=2070368 RepID=A0A2W2DYM5_9ACTN|nr:SDR family oxidoreductase [Nonomuraea aridisoli]PZG15141.1 short-chain dehydrogenase [Nonomuraea aridisoli]
MREDDLRVCLRVLAELAEAPPDDPDLVRVQHAVSAFTKRTRQNARTRERRRRVAEDAEALATPRPQAPASADHADRDLVAPTPDSVGPVGGGLVAPTPDSVGPAGGGVVVSSSVGFGDGLRRCYVCKSHFRGVGRLCPPCDAENRARRHARADLTGRRAVVTGGRVKAGFELVLKLLRDGAAVTAITRFPHDARRRFAAVPDSPKWADRLTVTGMDLRDVPALLRWCDAQVDAGEPLDILVNLAAQTVRPPAESYAALLAAERAAELTAGPGTSPGIELAGAGGDVSGLIPDLSPVNSWTRLVEDVDPVELLEVQLINVTAPFLLLGRLRPLLASSPHPRRYVVNVSAAEGQFDRRHKGPEHPHTNMAKAALNMLTRTSARELAAHGVYVTSVDPGWFSDQQPEPDRRRRAAAGFRPPLDDVDAAARVYDPIVRGEAGDPPYGCLLKDYRVAPW